jgi:hypothetical protein
VEKTTTPRLLRLCLLLLLLLRAEIPPTTTISSSLSLSGVKAVGVGGGEIHFFLSLEPFF